MTSAEKQAEHAKRMKRAVEDVLSGDVTLQVAYRVRRVDYDLLREELHKHGWEPTRIRQNNSRSRARQL